MTRGTASVAGLVIAALCAGSAGSSFAQVPQITLPEIVVTPPQPPPQHFRSTPGMIGNVRVEEDKWPVIACGGARINTGAAGKCQEGPKVMSAQSYMAGSNVPISYGDCTIAHQLITTVSGRFSIEADVQVFDPYKLTADQYNGACTVSSGFAHMPGDFRDMNRVARRGTGWHNFRPGGSQPGAQSTIEFFDGSRGCVAVERLGPLWHGGYVWVLHATLCQAGTTPPIDSAEISAAVGAIHIHTYDPNGNLRPPPGR